ncbi:MAG: Hsp70 family protein [Planctomycetes bacterium]|nr:Hsp70 family protein [Planctomycetota bacterium]
MPGEKVPMICGIDLGTTNSVIAYIDDHGKAQVIPNTDNERITPSVVLFDGAEAVVGKIAKNSAVTAPESVVQFIKRHMGEDGWTQTLCGKPYTPEMISALILRKLAQDAETVMGRKVGSVVITVPAYFNEIERKATQDAGIIAGLNVLSVLNEPTAAALAYGLDRLGQRKRVLVYDLGGGTLDVTVVQIEGTKIDVLATDGERRLGGIDWDDEVINTVAEKFKTEHQIDPRTDLDAYQDLRTKAEDAKIALSKLEKVRILCQCQGRTIKVELTRSEFERMTKAQLEQTETYLGVVLAKAKLTWKDIDVVLPVGGMTRMPAVREMLRRITGIEPDASVNPDECVAIGAAYYNAVLSMHQAPEATTALWLNGERTAPGALIKDIDAKARGLLQGVEVTNVNSHSLGIIGIRKSDGRMVNDILIPRNTPIPVERTKTYGTATANQVSVQIKVVEGEGEDPEDCVEIGTCVLSELPAGRDAGAKVDVTFRYDADGRLEVSARDRATGKEAKVEIQRKSGMTQAQITDAKAAIGGLDLG